MQGPRFPTKRNARRLAKKAVAEHKDKINEHLAKGYRLVAVPAGLVDALVEAVNAAGGWKATVEVRRDPGGNGSVSFKHDAEAARADDGSPIHSYEEVCKHATVHVAKATIEISTQLEAGVRAFKYPVGIVNDLIAGLHEPVDGEPSGWNAVERARNNEEAIFDVFEVEDEPAGDVTEPAEASASAEAA